MGLASFGQRGAYGTDASGNTVWLDGDGAVTAAECNCGGRGYVEEIEQPRERYCDCPAGVRMREFDGNAEHVDELELARRVRAGRRAAERQADAIYRAGLESRRLEERIRDLETLDTAVGWALSPATANEASAVAELRATIRTEVEAARAP